MNTSATGGYLTPDPIGPQPLEGDALVDFMQAIVVGITGLDGRMVRPRWQPEPPNLPNADESWVAIGITSTRRDTNAYVQHDGDGDGADNLQRHEEIDLLTSFYGPQADEYVSLLRDGLQVAQNREVMQLAGMGLVDTGDAIRAPTLVKDRWLHRIDMRVTVRRQILRRYPVLNLQSAQGTLHTEVVDTTLNVNQ